MQALCAFPVHAVMPCVRFLLVWRARRHRTGEEGGGVVRSHRGARERTMATTDPLLEA